MLDLKPRPKVAFSRSMHILSLTALVGALCLPLVQGSGMASNADSDGVSCTLTASGGDDGPAFVDAVQRCGTVIIPPETILSIATRMNMTGLNDKNIVCDCVLL